MAEPRTATPEPSNSAEPREDYRNPILDVDRRVDDLLSRMTLAEKARHVVSNHDRCGVR